MGTHTFVTLGVSPDAFEEICGKLLKADYGHAILTEPNGGSELAIDMHGLALTVEKPDDNAPTRAELIETLKDVTASLIASSSAYQTHACRHRSVGQGRADPFFTTRTADFHKSMERGRAMMLRLLK